MIAFYDVGRTKQAVEMSSRDDCLIGETYNWRIIEEMYAVIETGGKQYRVTEGDVLRVERLEAEVGDVVELDKVLSVGFGQDILIGTPYLDEKVYAKVVEHAKAEKVIVYKYKAKKNYHRKKGHRQPYSLIEIIQVGGKAPAGTKVEAEPKVEEKVEKETETAKADAVKVSMSMKKDELLEIAKENDVKVNTKMTKQEIIDAIEEDLK